MVMLRVGLTGGMGSGKSTVAALFAGHGVPVIDTDDIARTMVSPGKPAHREIVSAFGPQVLNAAGEIDRARLREIVFHDAAERKRLESILHPRIRADIVERIRAITTGYCLVVVPLLIEAGFTDLVNRILVVDADEDLCIARASARTGLGKPEIRAIQASQINRRERLRHADDVITNNSDSMHLEREVARLHGTYLALAASAK